MTASHLEVVPAFEADEVPNRRAATLHRPPLAAPALVFYPPLKRQHVTLLSESSHEARVGPLTTMSGRVLGAALDLTPVLANPAR